MYSKIGMGVVVGTYSRGLQCPPLLQKKTTAAKFASQGDAYMRNNTQIKFLYNPLITETCCGLSAEIFKYIFFT